MSIEGLRSECMQLVELERAVEGLDGVRRGKWTHQGNREAIDKALSLVGGDTFWEVVALLTEKLKERLSEQTESLRAALTSNVEG